jgi:hypothetical protein
VTGRIIAKKKSVKFFIVMLCTSGLLLPVVARSQSSVVFTPSIHGGAVSAHGAGNSIQGNIGEPIAGVASRSGGHATSAGTEDSPTPLLYSLLQNYPNPFNPSTTIRYGLPRNSRVRLTVFNILGEQIRVLQDGEQEAGYHEFIFDAKSLPSGVYFYRIQAGTYTETKRLLLLR